MMTEKWRLCGEMTEWVAECSPEWRVVLRHLVWVNSLPNIDESRHKSEMNGISEAPTCCRDHPLHHKIMADYAVLRWASYSAELSKLSRNTRYGGSKERCLWTMSEIICFLVFSDIENVNSRWLHTSCNRVMLFVLLHKTNISFCFSHCVYPALPFLAVDCE